MLAVEEIDLADADLYEHGDPDEAWAVLRREAPVYRNPGTMGREFWAVTRYRDAVAVYRDPGTFSSARGMVLGIDPEAGDPASGRMLVVTDPPRHPKLRRIISGVFTPRMMRRLEDRVRETVRTLVDRALAAEHCEFVDDVAARLPVAIICEILGVPPSDQDWMYHLTSTAFGGGDPSLADEVSPAARAQAYAEIFDYYQDLAAQRRRAPADDLVTQLVQGSVDDEPLDTEDVLLNCTNLVIGGNETTRHAAAGGLLALAERPVSWQQVRSEPAAVTTLVEEILRWTTPGMHAMRTVMADTTIGDQDVRAGESVVVWNTSANRDEEVFDDPQHFDVLRSPNKHIAFGQGGHHCLGASLARTELTVLFEELAKRVSSIRVAGPVRRVRSCVLRGIRRLPVELT